MTALADMTEREWTTQAVGTRTNPGLARMYGFWCYHVLRSRGSEPGFPDWVLIRERVVYLELKREKGRLSAEQKDVGRRLFAAGQEFYVARPSDLDTLAKVLGERGPIWGQSFGASPPALAAHLTLSRATREECGA